MCNLLSISYHVLSELYLALVWVDSKDLQYPNVLSLQLHKVVAINSFRCNLCMSISIGAIWHSQYIRHTMPLLMHFVLKTKSKEKKAIEITAIVYGGREKFCFVFLVQLPSTFITSQLARPISSKISTQSDFPRYEASNRGVLPMSSLHSISKSDFSNCSFRDDASPCLIKFWNNSESVNQNVWLIKNSLKWKKKLPTEII